MEASEIIRDYISLVSYETTNCKLSIDEILIKATFLNNYPLVKKIIDSGEFEKGLLQDVGLMDIPFPLHYVTRCHQVGFAGEFIEGSMPFVHTQRENARKLMELWATIGDIDVDEKIDYKRYAEYFHCSKEDEAIDDILFEPVAKYLDNGCRMIDLQLFEAVSKYQFSRVRELLDAGAKPDVNMLPDDDKDSDDPCNSLEKVGARCAYLCSCEIFPFMREKQGAWYVNIPTYDEDLGTLIGWAANEEMYRLLRSYVRK